MKDFFSEALRLPHINGHLFRKMKGSFILLLLSVCAVLAENTHSQETKVSLHVAETSIKEIIHEIERTTNYVFVLSDQVEAEVDKKVNVNTDGKDEMTQRIRDERACELAGEGQRYWDIRRWGLLQSTVRNATDIFGDLMYERIYQSRHEIWPIPLVEMERNTNLDQNPDW